MSRERAEIRYGETINKRIKRETDASSSSEMGIGRRHMLGPPGTLNTITPCAACKLLRRRCAQECPFSPYFSPHEPQKFASVHKVFGASNVSKLLMEVPESQRADAANSLVYEANVRLGDPIYGCMGAISALQQQVQSLQMELNAVRNEILRFKFREEEAANHNHNNIFPNSHHHVSTALLSSEVVPNNNVVPPPAPPPPPPLPQQQQLSPLLPPTSTPSSLYTQPTNAGDYNPNISNDNISYFG